MRIHTKRRLTVAIAACTFAALVSFAPAATTATTGAGTVRPLLVGSEMRPTVILDAELQEATATMLERLNSATDDNADLWITYDAEGRPYVHARTLSDRVNDDLTRLGRASNVQVVVDESEPFGPTARGVMDSDVVESLLLKFPDVVGLGADVANESIILNVSESFPATSFEDLEQTFERAGGLRFAVEPVRGAVGDSDTIYGGAAMSACTAGFTATRPGYAGFVTAAHCSPPQSYWNSPTPSGSASGPGTRRIASNRQSADIAFWSIASGDVISNRFYTDSSGTWVTTGNTATPIAGNLAYTYGKTTGYRYGQITSTSYKPTWTNACIPMPCNSTFVRVNAPQDDGDSGGPWYNQTNRPIGIHKGGSSSFSVYSKLAYMPSGTSIWRG